MLFIASRVGRAAKSSLSSRSISSLESGGEQKQGREASVIDRHPPERLVRTS